MKNKAPEYSSRKTRNKFISEHFSNYLKDSVLNVGGGGKKHLAEYLNSKKYIELDIDGDPDILINLDDEYPIPIEDNKYNTVICSDVLEHLEHFHRTFGELIRISNKYIIISLPNALPVFYHYLRRKKYAVYDKAGSVNQKHGFYTKYYGLPLSVPEDRHRWFFSYTEAEKFMKHYSKIFSYKILEEYPIGSKASSLKGLIARKIVGTIWGQDVLKDWFYGTYWCVLEKK